MENEFQLAAFKEYAAKLIWNKDRHITLLQAMIDTDISNTAYKMLEFIANELDEKEWPL